MNKDWRRTEVGGMKGILGMDLKTTAKRLFLVQYGGGWIIEVGQFGYNSSKTLLLQKAPTFGASYFRYPLTIQSNLLCACFPCDKMVNEEIKGQLMAFLLFFRSLESRHDMFSILWNREQWNGVFVLFRFDT